MSASSSNDDQRMLSRGNTITVNASGGGDYTHIRWAIDNASEGDTVYVEAGTYNENIVIRKAVELIGAGENKTIIKGNWINGIVMIMTDGVHISGFTITDTNADPDYSRGIGFWEVNGCWIENNVFTDSSSGISLDESSNNTIYDNIFFNNDYGIHSNSANNNTIFENIFLNSTYGISMYESNNNIVNDNLYNNNNYFGILTSGSKNNTISNNSFMSDGSYIRQTGISISGGQNNTISKNIFQTNNIYEISIESSTHNIIAGNEMMKNGISFTGSSKEDWATHSIDKLNTVNSKPVIYIKNSVGGIVPKGAGQIILANCSAVIVENRNLSERLYGLQVGFSSNNTITNNTASNNYLSGIYIYGSEGNIISNNTCNSNGENGIRLSGSGNHLINNNCNSNGRSGITVGGTGNNISNNICSFNKWEGINIWGDENTIYNNKCNSNIGNGIELSRVDYNTITNNTCLYNENGIELSGSERNILYKNTCNLNFQSAFSLNWESHDNTLDDNYASNNSEAISLTSSKRNTLVNNIMEGCGIYINGNWDSIEFWNTQNIDNSNLVNEKPVRYLKNETGGTVPPDAGQVILANCTGITVENQNVGNATVGIGVYYSRNNSILNNTCSNNRWYGIKFFNSSNNLVKDNIVTLNNRSGIHLSQKSENNTIDHNTCDSNHIYGINIDGSRDECNNNTIINNTCLNAPWGISIYDSKNNIISSNIIHNNSRDGINLRYATDNMLTNNNLTMNSIHIWGNSLDQWNTHIIDITNKVNGKPVYYWKNVRNENMPEGAGQIILANCSGVNIENLEISNTSTGILLGFSQYNTIANNNCKNNFIGIELTESSNNYIHYNTANENKNVGISIDYDSDGNIISENSFNDNLGGGLSCWDSSSNRITKNNFFSNVYSGIYYSGEFGSIEYNNISNNYYGIYIEQNTNSLMIVENDISYNENLGLYINKFSNNDNLIHHNNFVNNNNDGIQALDNGTNNVWNTNTEGNYWSDWTGPDTDGNGIVDDGYLINGTAGTYDLFPLTEPVDKTLPAAHAGQEKLVYEGATVELDGTFSYDDRGIENYTWSFVYNDRDVSIYGQKVNFTFEIPGVYEVNLTVTDTNGNEADDLVIIVVNPFPGDNVKDETHEPVKEDNRKIILFSVIVAIILVLLVWWVVKKRKNKMKSLSSEEERMKPK